MFDKVCDFENLLKAYHLARLGNRYKESALEFSFYLESNLFKIRKELLSGTYRPSPYKHFLVTEPKLRQVSAPAFRDRVVQHALFSVIEPIFEKTFIVDDYACRHNKGTHYALKRTKKHLQSSRSFYGKNSEIFILKGDIRKFFPSIPWDELLKIVRKRIDCQQTYDLIEKIVTTHDILGEALFVKRQTKSSLLEAQKTTSEPVSVSLRKGLPIGNLTSQLLANVYLNELDHFVKETLQQKWYGRYMDDFYIISGNKEELKQIKEKINDFVNQKLKMSLHPQKTFIQNAKDGLCFVGYRIFWDHILVRSSTLLRMQRHYRNKEKLFKKGKITQEELKTYQNSLKGHFHYADSYGLTKKMFGVKKTD